MSGGRFGRALVRPVAAGIIVGVGDGLLFAVSSPAFGLAALIAQTAVAVALGVTATVLAWTLLSVALHLGQSGERGRPANIVPRRSLAIVAAVVALVAVGFGVELTAGPSFETAVVRALALVAGTVLAASVAVLSLRSALERRSAVAAGAYVAVAALLLCVDAVVLPRLYPALHLGLCLAAIGAATLGAVAAPTSWFARFGRHGPTAVVVAAFLCAPWAVFGIADQPQLRVAVEDYAPLTGKVVAIARRSRRDVPVVEAANLVDVPTGGPVEAGPDLRGRDVLLVTVDALRADRLDERRMPQLSAIARDSVVFRNAYSPIPHTSYALASLFSGTHVRAQLQIGRADTLPSLAVELRRVGYSTASFHAPAVLTVDGARLRRLVPTGFGFTAQTQDFADARTRLAQLERLLRDAPRGRPLFVWTHLFEPHEPYEPRPPFDGGTTAAERYDGEVQAADAALGAMIASFEEARPGALIVVTSDHGESLGEHGLRFHGTALYEEQVRVPLVFRCPDRLAARTVDAPVDLTDVAPTLLAALGVPRPASMVGDNLGPALLGGAGPRYAYSEVAEDRMTSDGRYKLICTVGDPACRLYDLDSDPGETQDLSGRLPGRYRASLGGLSAALARFSDGVSNDADHARVLARGALADPSVAADLVVVLGSDLAEERRAAAQQLGRLRHLPALPILRRLRGADPVAEVRLAAATSVVDMSEESRDVASLGGALHDARQRSVALSSRRAAALVLAQHGNPGGARELRGLAVDPAAQNETRAAAIEALGAIRDPESIDLLVALLSHLSLRTAAADALGEIGDRRARGPLQAALEIERYPAAREAEQRALLRLR